MAASNVKLPRLRKPERRSADSDGAWEEKTKHFWVSPLQRRENTTNDTVTIPAGRQRTRTYPIQKIFADIVAAVDVGKLKFSDNVEAGKLPDGIDISRSDFNDYDEKWKGTTNDGLNLLQFAVKDAIDVGDEDELGEEDISEALETLENRINFVKWLLRSKPDMFRHKNNSNEEALVHTIEKYDTAQKGSFDCHIHRKLTHYFLSEISLQDDCRKILNDSDKESYYRAHAAIKQMGVDIIPYLHLFNMETLLVKDKSEGNTPLHVALEVQHWRDEEAPEKRVKLVSQLIKLCGGALTIQNKDRGWKEENRRSPYQYHQFMCKTHHEKRCERKSCLDVEFALKDAYLRLSDDQAANKHVYNGNQALYSHLDLSELRHVRPPPKHFLKNMEGCIGHLNLDTILKYVWLPKEPLLSGQSVEDPEAYIDYSVVFNWLRKKNVRRIIRLVVEDNEELPHSDETIVSAVKGIDVNIWDWRQYDLCWETILEAAPEVREVFLYSTGKKAVLLNWTSEEGLKKLGQLEKITIQIDLRPMAGENKFDYKEFVELRMAGLAAKIEVRVNKGCNSKGAGGGGSGMQRFGVNDGNQTDTWLRCMDRFAEFIFNIPHSIEQKAESRVVRIAIIDDGVDTHLPEFMNADIGGGVSFHTRGRLQDTPQATFTHHFPSTGGHGTEMAMRVRQVFPKAKLYIARLNVAFGENGNPTITASSAAEAIKWAVKKEVDIISMSWTVEKTKHNGPDLKEMESAIEEAQRKNILMFCAAKDGGYGAAGFGYPKDFNKRIFCIGATTEHGNISERLGGQKEAIDFGFPGENITPLSGATKSPIAGSSIATALAAGLAGLLLYIIQFEQPGKTSHDTREAHEWRILLQQHEKMKETLLSMANNSQKYIPVLKYFDIDHNTEWGNRGAENTLYKIVERIRMHMESTTTQA